jgi:two-component system repressor protein LuxO
LTTRLLSTVTKAIEHNRLLEELYSVRNETYEDRFAGMIGGSPQMRTIYSVIRNVAPTDVNIMITGESGTGKELTANAIHAYSDRSSGPFVPINMATIPHELAESTLFGHERGSFTGADRKRMGAVSEASKGSLFLDEIGEMPLDLQAKLLRFLQEQVYRPIGGTKDISSDVRIVSATNRNLPEEVKQNRFREDLFYRLNVIPIQLPPLREREGDISLLAQEALQLYSKKFQKRFKRIQANALEILNHYEWPGNVRELYNLIQRIVVLNDAEELDAFMIPEEIKVSDSLSVTETEEITPPSQNEIEIEISDTNNTQQFKIFPNKQIAPLEEIEKQTIEEALTICNGSAYEAAEKLCISTATIYRKIKLYKIDHK